MKLLDLERSVAVAICESRLIVHPEEGEVLSDSLEPSIMMNALAQEKIRSCYVGASFSSHLLQPWNEMRTIICLTGYVSGWSDM